MPLPDRPIADRPLDVFVGTDERQIEGQRSRRDDAVEGIGHLLSGNRHHLVEHPQIKWHDSKDIPIDDRGASSSACSARRRVLLGLAEQRLVPSSLDVGDLDRGQLGGKRPDRPALILAVASGLGQDINHSPDLQLGGIGRRHDDDDGPVRTLLDHFGHAARVPRAAKRSSGRKATADNDTRFAKIGTMAHHKRKRPKHRRSGCLLCKQHKLATNAKGERRRSRQASLEHERAADEEAEAIAAGRIKSGAADHKEDGAKALERLGSEVPLRGFETRFPD